MKKFLHFKRNHSHAILFLFLLVLLGACGGIPTGVTMPAISTNPSPTSQAPFDRVILSDGDFTPDEATIAELELGLSEFLALSQDKFNPTKAPIVERLTSYKIQYWGELRNGNRIVVVNALCTPLEGWQTRQVMVLDGGDCFFSLDYNPETKMFSNLSVNGEA